MIREVRCALVMALGLTVFACGSSASDEARGELVDAGVGADAGELWMLQTRLFVDPEPLGYAIPTRSLSGKLTNQQGIEQGGGGMVFATPGTPNGSFLLSGAEKPELTRYQSPSEDKLVPGTTLTFANFGEMSGYGSIAWVDAHTAYWYTDSLTLIRFDPTDMVVIQKFPIEGIEREGYVTELSGYPVVREDGVYLTVRWRKEWEDLMPQAPKGAALVHIDPATNEITVTHDERCTSLLVSMVAPSGDTYWFSDNYNTYARILGGESRGVPDCALRLRKGEKTFDPSWYLDLTTRTGGRPGDVAVTSGGTTAWLSVYHGEQLETPPKDVGEIDPAPAWRWYKLKVEGDAPAVEDTTQPTSSHGAFGWYAGGRSFTSTSNHDYSESKLLEVTTDGFIERATVQGLLDAIIRVR